MLYFFKKIIFATYYSLCGLQCAMREEYAFRIEALLSLIIIPVAVIYGHTALEKAVLLLTWALVLLAELLNSALENAIDRISQEIHPLSRRAKDMGSAAVFVAWLNWLVIWSIIFAYSA